MAPLLQPIFNVDFLIDKIMFTNVKHFGHCQIRVWCEADCIPGAVVELQKRPIAFPESDFHLIPAFISSNVFTSQTFGVDKSFSVYDIKDTFFVEIQLPASSDFKEVTIKFYISVNFCDFDDDPNDFPNFSPAGVRCIEVILSPTTAHAICRSLTFEHEDFFVLSFGVFSSLVCMETSKVKLPKIQCLQTKKLQSEQCRRFFPVVSAAFKALLFSLQSLEALIMQAKRFYVEECPTNVASVDMNVYLRRLKTRGHSMSTAVLLHDVKNLNSVLCSAFLRVSEIFLYSKEFQNGLYTNYEDWKLRTLSEHFFYVQKSMNTLFSSEANQRARQKNVKYEKIEKSDFRKLENKPPVFCARVDVPLIRCPMILEERFIRGKDSCVFVQEQDEMDDHCFSSSHENLPSKNFNAQLGNATNAVRFFYKGRDTQSSSTKVKHLGNESSRLIRAQQFNLFSSEDDTVKFPTRNEIFTHNLCTTDQRMNLTIPSWEIPIFPVIERLRFETYSQLRNSGCKAHLYSARKVDVRPCFYSRSEFNVHGHNNNIHLVVLVHGLDGTAEDLLGYKNYLSAMLGDTSVVIKESIKNENCTFTDIEQLGQTLAEEVKEFCRLILPSKLSFIGHSLGGLIIRAALNAQGANWMHDLCHTLLTLNAPHIGLAFSNGTFRLGTKIIQKILHSKSLNQLLLQDADSVPKSFLYKLAHKPSFRHFKHVLLVSANRDFYVPQHSSSIYMPSKLLKNRTLLGIGVREMAASILTEITTSTRTESFIRYTTFHNVDVTFRELLLGRAEHTAPVDDEPCIEKLTAVSFVRFFRND